MIGVAVGPPGLADQGLHRPIPAGLPEVDVRPALVVLLVGAAHAVFLRVFHPGIADMPCPALYSCS